jgi:hypothetical protein
MLALKPYRAHRAKRHATNSFSGKIVLNYFIEYRIFCQIGLFVIATFIESIVVELRKNFFFIQFPRLGYIPLYSISSLAFSSFNGDRNLQTMWGASNKISQYMSYGLLVHYSSGGSEILDQVNEFGLRFRYCDNFKEIVLR